MANLSDLFSTIFLSANNPFVESVTYTHEGVATVINAIVYRGGIGKNKNKADNTVALYEYEIEVACKDIPKVTLQKDTVTIDVPQYGGLNSCAVVGIVSKTSMAWKLGLRL